LKHLFLPVVYYLCFFTLCTGARLHFASRKSILLASRKNFSNLALWHRPLDEALSSSLL
jgi:hypothetical protein